MKTLFTLTLLVLNIIILYAAFFIFNFDDIQTINSSIKSESISYNYVINVKKFNFYLSSTEIIIQNTRGGEVRIPSNLMVNEALYTIIGESNGLKNITFRSNCNYLVLTTVQQDFVYKFNNLKCNEVV
jgi:hypothetical protein